jgi:N-acetylglucosamine kinase-like BadF-type ATPase
MLIAEAGGTKTMWALIKDDGMISNYQSSGIHPLIQSDFEIQQSLMDSFKRLQLDKLSNNILQLYYYGTGCIDIETKSRLHNIFEPLLPKAKMEFFSDLEGACIATGYKKKIWVIICGTGSNSCIWNGKKITFQVPSGGYILGDEGSGTYMGKKLLKDVIRNNLPSELALKFNKTFNLNYEHIIHQLYESSKPNSFLASFVPFIYENKKHPYMKQLVKDSFKDLKKAHESYFKNHNITLPNTLAVFGSIPFVFVEQFDKVFSKHYIIKKLSKDSFPELVKHHLKTFVPCNK